MLKYATVSVEVANKMINVILRCDHGVVAVFKKYDRRTGKYVVVRHIGSRGKKNWSNDRCFRKKNSIVRLWHK